MIKIGEKLWYIVKPENEDALAYMCPYEETKEGNPTSSVSQGMRKRMSMKVILDSFGVDHE